MHALERPLVLQDVVEGDVSQISLRSSVGLKHSGDQLGQKAAFLGGGEIGQDFFYLVKNAVKDAMFGRENLCQRHGPMMYFFSLSCKANLKKTPGRARPVTSQIYERLEAQTRRRYI
jgi:hypothetical protein